MGRLASSTKRWRDRPRWSRRAVAPISASARSDRVALESGEGPGSQRAIQSARVQVRPHACPRSPRLADHALRVGRIRSGDALLPACRGTPGSPQQSLTNDGPARSAEQGCAIGKPSSRSRATRRSCRSGAPSPPLAAAKSCGIRRWNRVPRATHRRRALSATRRVSATLRRLPWRVWATCRRAWDRSRSSAVCASCCLVAGLRSISRHRTLVRRQPGAE